MRKAALMVVVFSIVFQSYAAGFSSMTSSEKTGKDGDNRGRFEYVRDFLKGEKARNGLMIGMWSRHFYTHAEYRTEHNLIGLQYDGYFLGTFSNSHSNQVFVAGIGRTVAKKELGKHWLLESGYKIGPMYGYRRGIPNIARLSVLPLVSLGVSYRNAGVDINLVPGNAISVNFRVNF